MAEFSIYQIKVTLRHIQPPIWRRIQVSSDTSLDELHDVLQATMGWWDAHLHQFIVGETRYSLPYDETFPEDVDERTICLDQIVTGEGFTFLYEYDFGDSWIHELVVEKIMPPEPGQEYPLCLEGERACPPEDVGGPWGYGEFLEAMEDPKHPEHESYVEWIGGPFDPEAFDLEVIDDALRCIQMPRGEGGIVEVETPIGVLVHYPEFPPYVKYFLFRPDQPEVMAEIRARRAAGETIDWEGELQRIVRYAELDLAVIEDGFQADLYLDRTLVGEDEVDEIVAVVCEMLDLVEVGPGGGDLNIWWIEPLASYTFPFEE